MHLNIISDSPTRTPLKKIRKLAAIIEEEEEPPDSTVNIIFIDDTAIARLNQEFRNKTGPTDVLSFNMDNDGEVDSILGEIYISTDTAGRNASLNELTFNDEILRLCCHGFLHLLGYDHIRPRDRRVMVGKEIYYLKRLSI